MAEVAVISLGQTPAVQSGTHPDLHPIERDYYNCLDIRGGVHTMSLHPCS